MNLSLAEAGLGCWSSENISSSVVAVNAAGKGHVNLGIDVGKKNLELVSMLTYLGVMGNSKSRLSVLEAASLQDLPGLLWLLTPIKVSMNGSCPLEQELSRQHGSQLKAICRTAITLLVQGAACGNN